MVIIINYSGYEYNIEYWKKLRSKLKPAKKAEPIICKNAIEYRKILNEKKKDKGYVFSEVNFTYLGQSIQEKYDGYFYITTYNPSYTIIKNKISKAYPGMDFRMGEQLGSGLYTPCDYQIYASKEFYEKFNLYSKKEYKEFKDIKLTLYFKE